MPAHAAHSAKCCSSSADICLTDLAEQTDLTAQRFSVSAYAAAISPCFSKARFAVHFAQSSSSPLKSVAPQSGESQHGASQVEQEVRMFQELELQ
jgi:hypothetical protein